MWVADKVAYRGNMNFVRAYKGTELIWERVIPNNVIYYTSIDGNIVVPFRDGRGSQGDDYTAGFGAAIISNTYIDGLGEIVFDGPVTKVEFGFTNCHNLRTVELPNTVTSIDISAFDACILLQKIEIPNSVTSIGTFAFHSCESLEYIKIGSSVSSISNDAFYQCHNLAYITVDSNNTTYDSRNDCNSIIKKSNTTLVLGSGNSVIPNNVTAIGVSAFRDRYSLTSISIPASVTSIDNTSYQSCKNVVSITVDAGNTYFQSRNSNCIIRSTTNRLRLGCQTTVIPDSVTAIGDYAFYGQRNIISMNIPSSVTTIGVSSFYDSGLSSITIPSSVTSIGANAFNHCRALEEAIVNRTTPPTLGASAFTGAASNFVIRVPAGSVSAYQSAARWSDYTIVSQ